MANQQLANFFAHSIELESEARDRYEELAESMATHHNQEVAAFFQRMVNEASLHLQEVTSEADGLELPELKAWDFNWPDAEPPETVSYEAVHYRMSLRQAMALALKNEQAAERFYRHFADTSEDTMTAAVARVFADEELSGAAGKWRLPAGGG
jgi:rubrerythrin